MPYASKTPQQRCWRETAIGQAAQLENAPSELRCVHDAAVRPCMGSRFREISCLCSSSQRRDITVERFKRENGCLPCRHRSVQERRGQWSRERLPPASGDRSRLASVMRTPARMIAASSADARHARYAETQKMPSPDIDYSSPASFLPAVTMMPHAPRAISPPPSAAPRTERARRRQRCRRCPAASAAFTF